MPISFGVKKNPPPEIVAGLRKDFDTSPLTSTLQDEPDVVDGDRYTSIAAGWQNGHSYGFDFGKSTEIAGLDIWVFVNTTGTFTSWVAANDLFGAYKSDDNANWTLIQLFDGPPLLSTAPYSCAFRCEFDTPQSARYFKLANRSNANMGCFTTDGIKVIEATELEPILI